MERSNPFVDRISVIPNDVMRKIQKLLPIQDIARMSVLAKSWRNKWKSAPYIILHLGCLVNKSDPLSHVTTRILSEHEGPIEKMSLFLEEAPSIREVETWMSCLSLKDVQDISFRVMDEIKVEISSHLFQCKKVKRLDLFGASLGNLPKDHWQGFPSLVRLDLREVEIERTDLERLISSCPLLKKLILVNIATIRSLVIRGSNLKEMYIEGVLEHIQLITPILSKLAIHLYNPKFQGASLEQGLEIHEFPPSLRRLGLGSFWKFLRLPMMLRTFQNALYNLDELSLENLCLRDVNELSCFINTIRYAPNLKKLFIKVCLHYFHSDFSPVEEFWKSNKKSGCHLFCNLSDVTIDNFPGEEPGLRFVELLLSYSPLLQVMTIAPPVTDVSYEEKAVIREAVKRDIMMYPIASSTVKVLYLEATDPDVVHLSP